MEDGDGDGYGGNLDLISVCFSPRVLAYFLIDPLYKTTSIDFHNREKDVKISIDML